MSKFGSCLHLDSDLVSTEIAEASEGGVLEIGRRKLAVCLSWGSLI